MLFRRPDIARHVIRLFIRPDKGRRLYRTEERLVSATIRKVAVRLDAMNTFVWDGEEIPRCDDMWFALRMLWVLFWCPTVVETLIHPIRISCPHLRYIGTTIGYNVPSINSHVRDVTSVLLPRLHAHIVSSCLISRVCLDFPCR
jgi:hypothetical protein